MSTDFIPDTETQLVAWMTNFRTVALANQGALNIEPGDNQTITDDTTGFTASMTAMDAAKNAFRGSVSTKNSKKSTAVAMARAYAKRFKSIPGVDPGLLEELGIVGGGARGPVVPVTGLTVNGCSDGVNQLKWNRSTNSPGTVFIIESRLSTGNWEVIAVVSKTSFDHVDQPVGEEQWYRIKANRSGQTSPACPAVAVYLNGGSGLAEAA
jgi:hypothetical protein